MSCELLPHRLALVALDGTNSAATVDLLRPGKYCCRHNLEAQCCDTHLQARRGSMSVLFIGLQGWRLASI